VALTVQFDASEQLDVGNYTVSISPLIQSYADVPLADGMQETVEVEPASEEPGEDGSDDGVPNDESDTTDSSDGSDSTDESSSGGSDPPSDEETVPDVEIPAGVEALQIETVPVAYNVSTGTSQVAFGSETPVERIDFVTGGVAGEVSVAALSGQPESTGAPPGATVSVTQITVPAGAEDEPATVRMRVDTDSITEAGSTSGDLRVARYADGEWQALETTLVEETADTVILEAETPGFSLFAVSAVTEPDAVISLSDATVETGASIQLSATDSTDRYGEIVAYEWSIADQELTGETATLEMNEPGEYTVRLTIRNDAGETSTATATLRVQSGDEAEATDGSADEETTATGEADEETTATAESEDEPAQSSSPLLTFGPVLALIVLVTAGLMVWRGRRGES
jgi:PGF-pre-PGF domain-containing protein